jgi:hypothetical protein
MILVGRRDDTHHARFCHSCLAKFRANLAILTVARKNEGRNKTCRRRYPLATQGLLTPKPIPASSTSVSISIRTCKSRKFCRHRDDTIRTTTPHRPPAQTPSHKLPRTPISPPYRSPPTNDQLPWTQTIPSITFHGCVVKSISSSTVKSNTWTGRSWNRIQSPRNQLKPLVHAIQQQ